MDLTYMLNDFSMPLLTIMAVDGKADLLPVLFVNNISLYFVYLQD